MRINRTLLAHAAFVALFLGLWEFLARAGVISVFFISSPSAVFAAFIGLFREKDPDVLFHAGKSLRNFAAGYLLSLLAAVSLGVPAGYFKRVYGAVRVYAQVLYSVPKIAFIPLLILWLGIGDAAKIGMIFVMTFFTIFMSAMEAARSVNRDLADICRVYGAGPLRTLFCLVLPSCARPVITGAKLGVGRAVTGMILSETFGVAEGLGYLLFRFGATYSVSKVLAVLMLLMAFTTSLFYGLELLERKLVKWEA